MKQSAGQYLKEHREKKGLSIADLAKLTKMQEPLIVAIESDNIKNVGGAGYGLAICYSLCEYIDGDKKKVVELFNAKNYSQNYEAYSAEQNNRPIFISKRMISVVVISGVVLILSAILFFIYKDEFPSIPFNLSGKTREVRKVIKPKNEVKTIEVKPSEKKDVKKDEKTQEKKKVNIKSQPPQKSEYNNNIDDLLLEDEDGF